MSSAEALEALEALRSRFPDAAIQAPDPAVRVNVEAEALRVQLEYLRDSQGYAYMVFMTAVDRPEQSRVELVYRLFSYATRCAVAVHVLAPRETPRVASVCDLYRTAEWHERETAEMFGIEFTGHPDPRKLLLPDEIEGYPLRKDFTHPNMIPLPEVE